MTDGGPARDVLAQRGTENTSGSARAVDQKGLHFPGKAEDAVGGEGESFL